MNMISEGENTLNSLNKRLPLTNIIKKMYLYVTSKTEDRFTQKVKIDRTKHFVVSLLGSKLRAFHLPASPAPLVTNTTSKPRKMKHYHGELDSSNQMMFSFVSDVKSAPKFSTLSASPVLKVSAEAVLNSTATPSYPVGNI